MIDGDENSHASIFARRPSPHGEPDQSVSDALDGGETHTIHVLHRLVCGRVGGHIDALFARVTAVNAKAGPFDVSSVCC